MKYKYQILLTLYLLALTSAVFISLNKVSQICSPTEGCNTALNSPYASIAGIKVSSLGIIALTTISFIILLQLLKKNETKRRMINLMGIIAGLSSLRFLYLQNFVIHAYCKYCLVSDISIILAAILLITTWKNETPNPGTRS